MMVWFQKVKEYYDKELWSMEMVRNAVVKRKITEAEFKKITGEDY